MNEARQRYIEKHLANAAKAFSDHVIRFRTDSSWLVQQRYKDDLGWDRHMWFEIVSLQDGSLLVHGDINHVMFTGYDYNIANDRSADFHLKKLFWLSRSGIDYVQEKAAKGMGDDAHDLLIAQDSATWIDEAVDHIDQCGSDGNPCEYEASIKEWIDFLSSSKLDDEVVEEIADEVWADDTECVSWGNVPSVRFLYAIGAIKALVRLIESEEQAKGTEDVRPS